MIISVCLVFFHFFFFVFCLQCCREVAEKYPEITYELRGGCYRQLLYDGKPYFSLGEFILLFCVEYVNEISLEMPCSL